MKSNLRGTFFRSKIFTEEILYFLLKQHNNTYTKLNKNGKEFDRYMERYYKGFAGFELEYFGDFYEKMSNGKTIDLAEYEMTHLDENPYMELGQYLDVFFSTKPRPNSQKVAYRTAIKLVIFIIKLGGQIIQEILKEISREKFSRDVSAAKMEESVKDRDNITEEWIIEKRKLLQDKELKEELYTDLMTEFGNKTLELNKIYDEKKKLMK
ncbi:hypothetical protein C1646_817840 [Rhizophagus diaphanus]|nr:hypothetical protein C1646_817840 [Rhizophagus diaphanus] [Rhizophagus sp. MUCL 43196]